MVLPLPRVLKQLGHMMIEEDAENLQLLAADLNQKLPYLPNRFGINPDISDYRSEGVISPYELAKALDIATDGGKNPISVLDLTHCFSASLEQFYELSNPNKNPDDAHKPYAEVMIGSPNYTYFSPGMFAGALKSIQAGQSSTEMAVSILEAYKNNLEEVDISIHPHLIVAVDSFKIPRVKWLVDDIAFYLMQGFEI